MNNLSITVYPGLTSTTPVAVSRSSLDTDHDKRKTWSSARWNLAWLWSCESSCLARFNIGVYVLSCFGQTEWHNQTSLYHFCSCLSCSLSVLFWGGGTWWKCYSNRASVEKRLDMFKALEHWVAWVTSLVMIKMAVLLNGKTQSPTLGVNWFCGYRRFQWRS